MSEINYSVLMSVYWKEEPEYLHQAMTSIYNQKGMADECGEMLINNPEAHALYKAQIDYRRGEIDKVYDKARYFLNAHSGFYAILGGGMLLAQCAIWRGDIVLFNEAKQVYGIFPQCCPIDSTM